MMPHEQRVIDEKVELALKVQKLYIFIGSKVFESLSSEEQSLLQYQITIMKDYLRVLNERIDLFN